MKYEEENATAEKSSPRYGDSLDLEGQNNSKPLSRNDAQEHTTSQSTTFIYLITYFLFNLTLTFYNKAVMGSVSRSFTLPH
jgi:hypothetical protein